MHIERKDTAAIIQASFFIARKDEEKGIERLSAQTRLKIYCNFLLSSRNDFSQAMTFYIIEAIVDMVYDSGAYLNYDCYEDWMDNESIQEEYAKYLEYWLTNPNVPEWSGN